MSKKFGQNFLLPRQTRESIADLVQISPEATVWEIGPGIGALTDSLLKRSGKVTVFEIDHGFARILRDEAFGDEPYFTLIEGDFLKTFPAVFKESGVPDRICGNLPYNVGSLCIAHLIEQQCTPKRMVFTLQKEVGQRLTAKPGDKLWSAFTILAAIDYQTSIAMTLNPAVFYPPPQVSSVVITMEKRDEPLIAHNLRTVFLTVVHDACAHRRKTLKNNLLSGWTGKMLKADGVDSVLEQTQISPMSRAEQLSITEFEALALAVQSKL